MIRMIQKQLIIPRGDTGTFSIPILTTSSEGDASIFTIFDPLNHKKIFEKVMNVENGTLNMSFTHADTVNLPVGSFVWDIKFYKEAEIVDGIFINGTEVNSYYAAFKLPVCEIRQTGDALLIADDAPTSTIAPEQLNIILAATDEINTAKREVINAAEVVEANTQAASDAATSATADAARAETAASAANTSASAASQSATDANSAKNSAVAANTAAQQALLDANSAATIAATKATEASTSATAANNSASAASNSASAASSSANEAATSASNAASSVTEMEALIRAIPTNVSEFENDVGYITAAALPTKISDLTDDSGHYTKPTAGIPASDLEETYLTTHQDISSKADKSEIPTLVSQLTNDAGYLTSFIETDPTVPAWAKATQKPSYTAQEVGALPANTVIPTVPTNVSAFTNDVGYLTQETDPTVPSWAKASTKPTYTAAEVGAITGTEVDQKIAIAIGNIDQFRVEVVQTLPVENIKTHTIYFVPKTGDTNDVYDEYMYLNNSWEIIGSTQIDLTDYALKSEIPNVPTNVGAFTNDAGYLTQHQDISGKANTADLATIAFSGDYDDLENKPSIPSVPVQDVQANGVSVLSNGIANIPRASSSAYGVVKINTSNGIGVGDNSGTLMVIKATASNVKAGTGDQQPITASIQHNSVFYGLAKAAGDTTQSASSNAVGTYTADAKAAIQTMLGVPSITNVPTKVSDLTNDSGFITSAALPTKISDLTDDSGHYIKPSGGIPASDLADTYLTSHQSLTNYVQKTDYAAPGIAGLVQDGNGLTVGGHGELSINPTTATEIKTGTEASKPIVPAHQHEAVFYGLATAAGDTSQKISSNSVGTYTSEAQQSIQKMLGISSILAPLEESPTATQDYAVNDLITTNGKLYKVTQAITTGDTIVLQNDGETVANSNAVETKITDEYIRTTDYATSSKPGIVSPLLQFGTMMYPGTQYIAIAPADDDGIKNANQSRPIIPNRQHLSVFYGLATAAGDTTQALSSNAVGTYTATAKAAIQTMLGVPSISDIPTVPVQDVQANGTSIVSSGTATVPRATLGGDPGLVRVSGYGMGLTGSNATLTILAASDTDIKEGSNQYKPIVPTHQHESIFYGLAKAAGDITQSASNNSVGTYTADAKTAIRTMLGVPSTTDIPSVPVQDVQINGTTILSSGIANITADGTTGVTFSTFEQSGGTYKLGVQPAWQPTIKAGTEQYRPICASNAGVAAFYGLAKAAGDTTQASSDNAVGTYTASAKSSILTMIGADIGVAEETVSGTTPTITAATNTRYICGEVSTISITPCATGSCEIIFTSGTTPAVLTLPNTVKLPDWFDATSLEINRIYDILITNGAYGAVMSWAS